MRLPKRVIDTEFFDFRYYIPGVFCHQGPLRQLFIFSIAFFILICGFIICIENMTPQRIFTRIFSLHFNTFSLQITARFLCLPHPTRSLPTAVCIMSLYYNIFCFICFIVNLTSLKKQTSAIRIGCSVGQNRVLPKVQAFRNNCVTYIIISERTSTENNSVLMRSLLVFE